MKCGFPSTQSCGIRDEDVVLGIIKKKKKEKSETRREKEGIFCMKNLLNFEIIQIGNIVVKHCVEQRSLIYFLLK